MTLPYATRVLRPFQAFAVVPPLRAEGRLLLKGDTDAGLRWVNSLLRDAQK